MSLFGLLLLTMALVFAFLLLLFGQDIIKTRPKRKEIYHTCKLAHECEAFKHDSIRCNEQLVDESFYPCFIETKEAYDHDDYYKLEGDNP